MLSVAPVRSASGSANYFAKDDYYTVEGSSEISAWGGEGAEAIGLSGEVSKDAFEGALNGILPSGEAVARHENRRHGLDLTFSMPKSASVMAYVAGDKRVLGANLTAVKQTMAWVEKNLAEGRRDIEGRKVPIQTGNLVYALFQHDTSRALDPQAHIHAVIANLTRMPDGKWQALHADKIWSHNSIVGSIYHAYLRNELERLGYQIEMKGKHGAFEIAGVPKAVRDEYSQRREAILEKAAETGVTTHKGRDQITINTRDPKLEAGDRVALKQSWIDRAAAVGFDGQALRVAAEARAGMLAASGPIERGYRAIVEAIDGVRERLGDLLRPQDPLVDHALARAVKSPDEARTQLAVASAVRILSEREAAWPVHMLSRTALNLGVKGVTVDSVERRIGELIQNKQIIMGTAHATDRNGKMVTTQEALRIEERILGLVDEGKGTANPVLSAGDAPARLQEVAEHPLNAGQLAAATVILSSQDRTITVQGAAGTGKSTMLQAVSRVAEAEGRAIKGLAFQNKMVGDLADGAGIEAQTIASFVLAHERFITEQNTPRYEAAREKLAGTMLLVDETSMVSSNDMLKLHQIGAAMGVDKLVLVGDRQQLSSIDWGKAFAMIQAAGATLVRMTQNIRIGQPGSPLTEEQKKLKLVAKLADLGKASAALKVLGDNVTEKESPAEAAADMWLALSPAERDATAVFASGRDARAVINERIQNELIAEGSIKGEAIRLTVYERVNTTREELRYASTYKVGQTLEVGRSGAQDVGIGAGRYDVLQVHAGGKVELADGRRKIRFNPQKLSPTDHRERLQLSEKKEIHLREGDQIRWTANEKPRGLHNAALARVVGVDANSVTVETAGKEQLTLTVGDPMLSRLDLAYSLNMHMAQGITTDKAIGVMSSSERNLSNQRLFNVLVTRVRDALSMVVDDKAKLSRQLDMNPGNKTSSLETLGRLDIEGHKGSGSGQAREKFDPGPIDGVDLSGLPPLPDDLPPLPGTAAPPVKDLQAPRDLKPDRPDPLPPLPERSLGLDL